MISKSTYLWLAVGAIAIILSTGLSAQTSLTGSQEETQKQDSAQVRTPAPIPLIDVSAENSRVRAELIRVRERLRTERQMEQLDSAYNAFLESYDEALAEYRQFSQTSPNRQKLDEEISKWKRLLDLLNQSQGEIDAYQSRSTVNLDFLQFDAQTWELTSQTAEVQEAPQSLRQSIEDTRAAIDSTIQLVIEQGNEILELETDIANTRAEINDVIDRMEKWINSGELNIFYQRHNPVWNTAFIGQLQTQSNFSIDQRTDVIREYFRGYKGRVRIFIILVVLLMAFLFYLKRQTSSLSEHFADLSSDERLKLVPEKALPVVAFISLLFGMAYFKNTPDLLKSLVELTLLALAVYILRPFQRPYFYRVIPIIALLLVVESLKNYLWFSSPSYRLYMYAESVLILLALFYLLVPRRKVDTTGFSKLDSLIFRASYVLIPVQILALIANTLGYTNLSDVLIKLCVNGAVITVITYCFYMVVEGVMTVFLRGYFAIRPEIEMDYQVYVKSMTNRVIAALAVIFGAVQLLSSIELYRPLRRSLDIWLSEPWTLGSFSITPGNILTFLIVVLIAYVITKAIAIIIDGGVLNPFKVSRGISSVVSMVLRYLVAAFAVLFALGALGVDLSQFSFIAGALGIGIGFGLQNITSNFISGIILTFERPIEPGDTVEVGEIMGVVKKVGVRSSSIRSFSGADVILPNNYLLDNELVNWTHTTQRKRIEIAASVAYGTDLQKVIDILIEVATTHEHTLANPAPQALFDTFGDSSLNFRLLFWVPLDSILVSKSAVSVEIYRRFTEEGIEIPFPRQDVTILNDQKPDPKE